MNVEKEWRDWPDVIPPELFRRIAMLGRAGARPHRPLKKCTGFFRSGRLKIGIAPREKHPPNCVVDLPASELVYRVIATIVPIAPDAETIRR